jgi:hypothetical protein
MSSDPDARATRAIPLLRARLRELIQLSHDCVRNVGFTDDDHFAFMGLFFHAKQIEHAEGVLQLGSHPDSSLVARSMLEGMWQLKWAAQAAEERALRWRMFAIIYDWRVMREKLAVGAADMTEARRRKIEGRLPEAHETFLSNRAKKNRDKGMPLPSDPYQATWSGLTVRELAAATEGLDLYAGPYEDFSDRHHWSPAGIGFGIRQDGARLYYEGKAPTTEAKALSIAFQCLWESSMVMTEYLKTGYDDKLMDLTERYLTEHGQLHGETSTDGRPGAA